MSTFENIAEELNKQRQQQEWSQEDHACNLGVSFATVNRWKNGNTKPSKMAQNLINKNSGDAK
ncbi:MAG: helix-turn-helix transcriptional regulator [Lentisphaeria bacterium]|nr:helix-turn-helix transcriptional regulator [Lentisphaeria bacterium]